MASKKTAKYPTPKAPKAPRLVPSNFGTLPQPKKGK